MILTLFVALFAAPIAASATLYAMSERAENWQLADRSSAGLLPPAAARPEAAVRIFAARTVRWRGIFAVHSWIVFKEKGAAKPLTRTGAGSARCRRRCLRLTARRRNS